MLIKKIYDSIVIKDINNERTYESSASNPFTNLSTVMPSGSTVEQVLTDASLDSYYRIAAGNSTYGNWFNFVFNINNLNAERFIIARKINLYAGQNVTLIIDGVSEVVRSGSSYYTSHPESSATIYEVDAYCQHNITDYRNVIKTLYLAESWATLPVMSMIIGARSKATLNVNFNNDEGFASYNSAIKIRVFSEIQYNAAGFNPATSVSSFEDDFSKQGESFRNTISQSTVLTLTAESSTALVAGQKYRAYYFVECARVSDNSTLYQSGWLYTEFTPAEEANPPAPTIEQITTNVQQVINASVPVDSIPSGQLMDYVLIEVSRNDGSTWNELGKVYVSASGTGSIKDSGYNPTLISKYRAITCTRDSTDTSVQYRSLSSNIIASEKSELAFIIGATSQINNAIFSEFERGKFADDNVEQWCIGASAPVVSYGTKKLESGSFTIYCRSAEEIAAADAIIKSNAPVRFIADDGIYHYAHLKNTSNEYLQTVEKRSLFKADWQDLE